MQRSILGGTAVVAMALMLAFGAREALSAPAAAAVLSCENDEQCQEYCELKYNTQEVYGWCDGAPFGHCHCEF
ncbi:MAG TPA: hypothetical protein VFQ39_04270 [Longimicrobium sp.]|nr:hypothetical protein [Longimicrobium sp.]